MGTQPSRLVGGFLLASAAVSMRLNVLLVPTIIGLVLRLGRFVFGIEPGVIPTWVR
jgi:hypothetical protein